MTYLINGTNTRAGLRGGGKTGVYRLDGLGAIIDARTQYDVEANAMRLAAKLDFFKVPNEVVEAGIVAALGKRPGESSKASDPLLAAALASNGPTKFVDPRAAAIAEAKAKSLAATAACKASGGFFDHLTGGCRLPGDPPPPGEEPKSHALLYVGGAAAILLALALRG